MTVLFIIIKNILIMSYILYLLQQVYLKMILQLGPENNKIHQDLVIFALKILGSRNLEDVKLILLNKVIL